MVHQVLVPGLPLPGLLGLEGAQFWDPAWTVKAWNMAHCMDDSSC
jgi:hypothetical protein